MASKLIDYYSNQKLKHGRLLNGGVKKQKVKEEVPQLYHPFLLYSFGDLHLSTNKINRVRSTRKRKKRSALYG